MYVSMAKCESPSLKFASVQLFDSCISICHAICHKLHESAAIDAPCTSSSFIGCRLTLLATYPHLALPCLAEETVATEQQL